MKLQILDKTGKKVSEKETRLFEEPIREDIICKVVEAEKIWQAFSPKFRAGMDISASGNVSHRRHVWKSDRGRGLARIPKKSSWRRGTQFAWEGAIVPGTRGGRRAHPPKGMVNDKKINKKELKKALMSALSYVSSVEDVKKKYSSIGDKDVKIDLPLVVDGGVLSLKSKDFLESLKKILNDFYEVSVQKKSVRAGKGKLRGRKYKKNAGLLVVVGKDEDLKVKGVEVVSVDGLIVRDLASNGARLCMFSEKAIRELEDFLVGGKKKGEKKKKEKRVNKRKMKKEKRKRVRGKSKKKGDLENESEDSSSKESESNLEVVSDTKKERGGGKSSGNKTNDKGKSEVKKDA